MEPIDFETAAALKAKPETKPKPKRKSKKINVNDRTYDTWWKLLHHLPDDEGKIQCAFCPRRRMCANLSSDPEHPTYICRFCFLEGMGLPSG